MSLNGSSMLPEKLQLFTYFNFGGENLVMAQSAMQAVWNTISYHISRIKPI